MDNSFDNRSLDLDLQLNVAVAGPGRVAEVDEHFLADLTVSQEIDPQTWRDRPCALGSRARDRAAARLAGPPQTHVPHDPP